MKVILAVLSLMMLPVMVFAQDTITPGDAIAQLKADGMGGCVQIPVGVHRTPPLALLDDNQRSLVRSVVAWEKAGVVTVNSVGSLSENILTVKLKPDLDKTQFNPARPACIRVHKSYDVKRIVKIDRAEGGSTIKWGASLVYLIVEWEVNPYYNRYLELTGGTARPGIQSEKAVVLFRQDPFTQRWTLSVADAAAINAPTFEMGNVAGALRSD